MATRSQVDVELEQKRSQLVRFTNFSDKDFFWKIGGKAKRVNAQKTYIMELFKAEILATHLIDKELNSKGIKTNDVLRRKELLDKCISGCDVTLIDDIGNLNRPIMEEDEALIAEAEEMTSFVEQNSEIAKETIVNEIEKTEIKELTETEKNENLAIEMRDNGEHWKIVEQKTGVTAERQRELIMKGLST